MQAHSVSFQVDNQFYTLPPGVFLQIKRLCGSGLNRAILKWIESNPKKFVFARVHKIILVQPWSWDHTYSWAGEGTPVGEYPTLEDVRVDVAKV